MAHVPPPRPQVLPVWVHIVLQAQTPAVRPIRVPSNAMARVLPPRRLIPVVLPLVQTARTIILPVLPLTASV
jgi:hypothetical protein